MISSREKNTSPKITVITGYYNRAHALNHTIDSIMRQSFSNFEFIVFNDNSTDDTKERLSEIERKYDDPRLIIINHDHNKGFVVGMIDAIKMAKGEYICVQGSGDFSYPDRLMLQNKLLDEQLNVGAVGSYYENFIEDRNIVRERNKNINGINFELLLKENVYSHGEVMFRKCVYEQVGGYRKEFVNCQDYDLWLRMIKFSKLASVPKNLYRRYVRYDGVSYNPSKFLKQSRYLLFVRELAQKSTKEQTLLLKNLKEQGLNAMVSLDTPQAQKIIISAILRSLVWGEVDAAKELVNVGIKGNIAALLLKSFIAIYSGVIGKPLRVIVNYKLNIQH